MKFIYLADTHIGGSDTKGYRQQPRYLSHVSELIGCLAGWIAKRKDVDFVIHGGDIVDGADSQNIDIAIELFRKLPCPVYPVMGNHDLASSDAVGHWLEKGNGFFPENSMDFSLSLDGTGFYFLTCHWGKKPYFWDPAEEQIPYLSGPQLEKLKGYGSVSSLMFLIVHSPVLGLPCGQTGLKDPLHSPKGDFPAMIRGLAEELHVKVVLGAHNHMNMNVELNGVNYVTVSAFTETPFEFKLFEVTGTSISMETLSMEGELGFGNDYCFDRTFVQGRQCDRSFKRSIK